jgi:tetratricopeptide (TPR) repeat protein
VYRRQGTLVEAAANFRSALEIQGRFHGERHAKVGVLACTLAHIFFDQNLLEDALEMFQKAMKIYVGTLGKDCWDAGCICENMGLIKARQGKHVEALPLYHKAIGIYNRVHGVDKASEYAAGMIFSAAFSMFRMGGRDGTLTHLRESMRICTLLGISNVTSHKTARLLAQIEGCR